MYKHQWEPWKRRSGKTRETGSHAELYRGGSSWTSYSWTYYKIRSFRNGLSWRSPYTSGYQCSWEKCKISLPRPLNFFSSCLPFCWTQPCLLQTSLGRWTTRYLRPQHTRMIRQFSVEETKSAKGKAGQAQNKESARFRNTLSFSINLSRRNPTEFLRFRATHLRAI